MNLTQLINQDSWPDSWPNNWQPGAVWSQRRRVHPNESKAPFRFTPEEGTAVGIHFSGRP